MAQNQEPMNDEDLERAKEEIADVFDAVRADLDESADEDVDGEAVADGGH